MRIGTSYKQTQLDDRWDVIVVGSGPGGLSAASLLARYCDKRVLVLERHYTAGGFTHTFTRKGYEWDVGVHYVGEVGSDKSILKRIFDAVGDGSLEWADMGENYDSIVIDGERYDFVRGRTAWRAKMLESFPGTEATLDAYLALVRETTKKGQLFFAEKAIPARLAKLVGGFMRRGALKHASRTTGEVLAELTDDPRLRAVLAGQYGDYGLPPAQSSWYMHAAVVGHYIHGGYYPVGGASRIAASILPVIEAKGGQVITNADVRELVLDGKRCKGVRLADGRELYAPHVVSGIGILNTVRHLIPAATAQRIGFTEKVKATPPSVGHVSLYLGMKHTAEELGLPKGNLWIYPHDDHDRSCAEFIEDFEAPLPVVYISFPSAKDPDFTRRHPGRATMELVTLAPWEWFAKWDGTRWKKRGEDYEAFKARFTERLLEVLYRHVPQVEGKLDHIELSTPLSTKNFAFHESGEIYGISHGPDRFEQRWLRPSTPLEGFWLTGADVCSAGVAGALIGGFLTAAAMHPLPMIKAIRSGLPTDNAPSTPALQATGTPVPAAARTSGASTA